MIPNQCHLCHRVCDRRTMIPCSACGNLLCPDCAKEGGLCHDCAQREDLQQSL